MFVHGQGIEKELCVNCNGKSGCGNSESGIFRWRKGLANQFFLVKKLRIIS